MIRNLLIGAALLAAVAYVGMAALLFTVQRSLLFVPDTTHPDAAKIGIPSLREIQIPGPDGQHLLAWYVPPPLGAPVLAYFHGNGGNLANRSDRLRRFVAAGWGVLMPEYPGYGGNPGAPSETAFADAAARAMAFLDHEGIAPRRIAIYGESIGTGVATRTAAGRELGALVLESPFTSVLDIARRRFGFLPVGWLLRDRFDQVSLIGQVRCPILVLQGSRDMVVPPDLGLALFHAAPQPKEIWIAPQGGHNDLWAFGAADLVIGFLNKIKAVPF